MTRYKPPRHKHPTDITLKELVNNITVFSKTEIKSYLDANLNVDWRKSYEEEKEEIVDYYHQRLNHDPRPIQSSSQEA